MESDIKAQAIYEKEMLLNNMNSIILSTVDDKNKPNASYAPAAIDENGDFIIYISSLSRHTLNLLVNSFSSIMIVEDESKTENIFGRKRLTLDVSSKEVERDTDEWNEKINLLENKFGETLTFLKGLTDFHLFKLAPSSGLLVHGFARAFVFSGEGLQDISYLNDKGHSKK